MSRLTIPDTHVRKAVVFCFAVFVQPALAAGVVAAAGESAFTARVTSPRSTILVCEPLVLDIAVRNDGSSRVEFSDMDRWALGPLSFRVIGPDGRKREYLPLRHKDGRRHKVVLPPGEVYRYRQVLVYGVWRSPGAKRTAYAFPEPGEYLVHAVFQDRERRFESAPLKVTVVEPTGRDQEALELFRGRKQAEFIEHLTNKVPPPELERLATEYPDTAYGRYARFYLAATVLQHRFDWEEARRTFAAELAGLDPTAADHRLREEVYRKTASEFADLAQSKPAFPLADQCFLYLAECYLKRYVNRRSEAVKVLKDLLAKYPESPVAVKAKKRLEKLGKKAPAPTTRPSSP